ncbi:MAG TPA: hypothetical protein VH740_07215 [Vicinamibacterales bacterium]|jgi:hypothetical protein
MTAVRSSIASVLIALCCASTAGAQTFEAGATIAASCQGGGATLCDATQTDLATFGPYASVWFRDFIEVGGRVAWLERRDFSRGFGIAFGSTYFITERTRTIGQGEVVWHLLRGKRVRLMVGAGVGRYWDRELITCRPAGCEPGLIAAYGLTTGPARDSQFDQSILVGLSAMLHPRLRIRAGWRYHNPLAGDAALPELFIGGGFLLRKEGA